MSQIDMSSKPKARKKNIDGIYPYNIKHMSIFFHEQIRQVTEFKLSSICMDIFELDTMILKFIRQ